MRQFLNTVGQIAHSDAVGFLPGLGGYLHWKLRKAFRRFPCELKLGASRLVVDRPSGVAALVSAMGEYDYNNMNLVRLLLSRGKSTFIDVGANIGTYTLIASETHDAKIISIEPHPVTFARLRQSVDRNGRSNVVCVNVALSSQDGELRLTDEFEPAINRIVEGKGKQDTQGDVPVSGRRFESLCLEFKLSPDFVKIDVEGHERAVLEGFGELESTAKVILIEGGERLCVRQWMAAAGYLGPWFVHFNRRLLSLKAQQRPEDPVYVRQDFLTELLNMKFQVLQLPTCGARANLSPRYVDTPS